MRTRYLIYTLCFIWTLFGAPLQAQKNKPQTVTVEGIVVDENDKPMKGITVNLQEKKTEAVTGEDGHFFILADAFDKLVLNVNGYRPIVQAVMGKDFHTLKLEKYLTHENEMIGIAYGEQSKRASASAISSINFDEFSKVTVTNVKQALDGTVSGLYSMRNGGEKLGKNNFSFFVRGKATNATASPLIFVDDMEVDIDMIDFNEVESISVLKDASALAMYGMRGANGVILIKTKHGSNIKHSMKVDIRAGFQQAQHTADRLNAKQYTTLYNEGLVNDGLDPIYNSAMYDLEDRDPYLFPDVDFKNQYLKKNSPFQHYNFTASGGNDIARYFVSTGYMKEGGLFNTNQDQIYERYNFRSNLDINPFKGLTVNLSVYAGIDKNNAPYTYDKTSQESLDLIMHDMITTPANAFPLFNRNGSLGGSAQYRTNLEGILYRSGHRKDETRVLNVQVGGKYDFDWLTPGLSVDLKYGFENYNMQFATVHHSYAVFQEQPDGSYIQSGNDDNKDSRGAGLLGFYRFAHLIGGINYAHNFNGNHDLSLRLQYNHSAKSVKGDNPDYKYQALALRAQYGLYRKYFAELTATVQGSNYYTSGQRDGFFPALGLAWIASDEAWMQNQNVIDYLKLRASYGITGNDRTGGTRFPYIQKFVSGSGYSFRSDNYGFKAGTLANADETWETAYKFNAGFDLEMFKGLSITADYFHEIRKDVLVPYTNVVPSIIGVELPKYNAGEIRNQGFDMTLLYNKQFRNGGFFIGGNMLYAKNKVIELKEMNYKYDWQYHKGYSINTMFGYETNGIYSSEDQLANAPLTSFGNARLGDLIYKNQNPDEGNEINDVDKVALGNTFPELIYGLKVGGNIKGFDIQCTFEGSSNYSMFVIPDKFTPWAYENRWNPENPTQVTSYPRMSIENNYSRQTSDFYKQDVNMFRISTAEVGYTLPSRWVKKIMLSDVRIYANANNLFTFSNLRDDRNPEAVDAGYSQYPLLRTISFGISLKL